MPPGRGVQNGRLGLGTLARLQLQQHVLRDGGLACPTRTNGQTDKTDRQVDKQRDKQTHWHVEQRRKQTRQLRTKQDNPHN